MDYVAETWQDHRTVEGHGALAGLQITLQRKGMIT